MKTFPNKGKPSHINLLLLAQKCKKKFYFHIACLETSCHLYVAFVSPRCSNGRPISCAQVCAFVLTAITSRHHPRTTQNNSNKRLTTILM